MESTLTVTGTNGSPITYDLSCYEAGDEQIIAKRVVEATAPAFRNNNLAIQFRKGDSVEVKRSVGQNSVLIGLDKLSALKDFESAEWKELEAKVGDVGQTAVTQETRRPAHADFFGLLAIMATIVVIAIIVGTISSKF